MATDWVKEQIKIVEEATKHARKSKAAARKFLKDAGIYAKDKPTTVVKKG